MGLFDIFKKKKTTPKQEEYSPAGQKRTEAARHDVLREEGAGVYYGDLEKTAILQQAFTVPVENRDHNWMQNVLSTVADASFTCENPQVIKGPDGFPYVRLGIPVPGEPFQCYVIKHMKDDFLLEKGFGVAIFSDQPQPEWIFSYGDIVNYHLNGSFTAENPRFRQSITGEEEAGALLAGQPAEQVLPGVVRKVLGQYLKSFCHDPKVALIMHREDESRELAFTCTPDKFESQEAFESVMQGIGWFLPRDYSYCVMRDQGQDFFVAL